jgi:hypothetical protein
MIANEVVVGLTLQSLYFSRTVVHWTSGLVWDDLLRSPVAELLLVVPSYVFTGELLFSVSRPIVVVRFVAAAWPD